MNLSELKLKPGGRAGTIVSETPTRSKHLQFVPAPSPTEGSRYVFLVAESVPPEIRPLFIAATDLLAACENVLVWGADGYIEDGCSVWDMLHAAIAKAKGETA